MLKIHSDVKLVKAVLYVIFFLVSLNSLNAEGLDEEGKKSMSILFYVQTSGKNSKFINDLDDNVLLKDLSKINSGVYSKPNIVINNCFLTDFDKTNQTYQELERLIGKENNVLLMVSSVYKSLKIDHLREISKQTTENWLISNKVPHKSTSLSCKKDKSGYYGLHFNSGQVVVIPKFLEPALKTYFTKFPNNYSLIAEIRYNELVNKSNLISSNKQKIIDEKNQLNSSYSNSKNKSSIGGLILNLPSNYSSGIKNLRTCTASYKDINAQRVFGYRLLNKSILLDDVKALFNEKKLGLPTGSKFDKAFKDVNDAYLNFIDKKTDCSLYIDYAENIFKLKKGLDKKKVSSLLTKIIPNQTLENKYAVSRGFTSANEKLYY